MSGAAARPAHRPVMLAEVLAGLAPRDGATYVDATFGAGGYARAILEAAACTVVGIDRDPEACHRAADLIALYGGRLEVVLGRFGAMVALLAGIGIGRVDGIAFDLGVSSPQLDDGTRGFSFRLNGPLDMRMDPDAGTSAADAVNALAEDDLARIIATYGEDRAARRIARAIVRARAVAPIATTARLAEVVRAALPPRRERIDPATRTFQALRIHVNDELGELDQGLAAAEAVLNPGGRLCVVAFHSLEDRRVKSFLRTRTGWRAAPSRHRPDAPATDRPAPTFRLINAGALKPSREEIETNPRARSARLRIAERTAAPAWPAAGAEESCMSPWSTVFRQTAVLFLLLGVGLAVVLFTLKQQVQALEKELVDLNSSIAKEENTVRVLRAEFDVLTDADRLERLSARHLDLAPLEPEQMASFSRLRQLLEGHSQYATEGALRAAIGPAWRNGGGQ